MAKPESPEFLERSNLFLQEAIERRDEYKKRAGWVWFEVEVEDALEYFSRGADKLAKVLEGDQLAKDHADKLDEKAITESIIMVTGHSDRNQLLKEFMVEIKKLADQYGGVRSSFMSPLSNSDDGIRT